MSWTVPLILEQTILESVQQSLAIQAQYFKSSNKTGVTRIQKRTYLPLRIITSNKPPASSISDSSKRMQTLQQMLGDQGIYGPLRREPSNPKNWLGGYWLLAGKAPTSSQSIWIYASAETSLRWLWPLIQVGSVLIGTSTGFVLFLRWQLENPVKKILRFLPDFPSGTMELVPEEGISVVHQLSIRINRMLRQINRQESDRKRFMLGLAHDLGGPLTRLSLRIEQLEKELACTQEDNVTVQKAQAEISRLSNLIHHLQDAAGEQVEPFKPVMHSVRELCEAVARTYQNKQIVVEGEHIIAKIDKNLIERALHNLIDNAIRHGRPPAIVKVRRERGHLVIAVEDSGSSFPAIDNPSIVDRDSSWSKRRTPLGLAIVERCCEIHGGRMRMQSSALGGLRAEIHIPF